MLLLFDNERNFFASFSSTALEVHPNDQCKCSPPVGLVQYALDILDSKSIQLCRGRPELLEFF